MQFLNHTVSLFLILLGVTTQFNADYYTFINTEGVCNLDTPHYLINLVLGNGNNYFETYSGNPLNCDCQTKWLRNWVSTQTSSTTPSNYDDEPRCYFPKSLSGNALRQLR